MLGINLTYFFAFYVNNYGCDERYEIDGSTLFCNFNSALYRPTQNMGTFPCVWGKETGAGSFWGQWILKISPLIWLCES